MLINAKIVGITAVIAVSTLVSLAEPIMLVQDPWKHFLCNVLGDYVMCLHEKRFAVADCVLLCFVTDCNDMGGGVGGGELQLPESLHITRLS